MGYVVLGLAAVMLACAGAGVVMGLVGFVRPGVDEGSVLSLGLAALMTGVCGLGLRGWGEAIDEATLSRRDAFVMVGLVWALSGVLGALPYVFGAGMGFSDAVFEAISGFTTTGATVVSDIEGTLSRPVLLWRSLTQWLGGMGIIVLFVAVFPRVGAGGKHLFRAEVPGPTADMLRPRITQTALALWGMYVALTVAEILALLVAGMEPFEAVCHALTTVSTGGFSTRDASAGAWNDPVIEGILAVFMLLAGVNFGLYFGALRSRKLSTIYRSTEFRAYLGIVVATTVLLTLLNLGLHDGDLLESFRYGLFTTATFITSTGYGTEDYMQYGSVALLLVLGLMFVGGSAGSTAGGIKVSRFVLVGKTVGSQVRHSIRPNVVQVVRMGRQRYEARTLLEVAAFICVFMGCLGAGTVLVAALEQVGPGTAFGATLTCLSNMGPAPFHGGVDNFAGYMDVTKLLFSFIMVLGRLELMTLLALMLPEVWSS